MLNKTKISLMVAALLLSGMPQSFAFNGYESGEEVQVILTGDQMGSRPTNRPRMPANRPLLCIYNVDSNALTVTSRNRPLSSVQVQNLTTGEMFSDQCFGNSSVIYLSGTSGLWQVTITLDDDSIHIGMFDC